MVQSSWQKRGSSKGVIKWTVFFIFVLTIVTGLFVFPEGYNKGAAWLKSRSGFGLPTIPGITPFVFGLDLKGGAHMVYEADTSKIATSEQRDAVEGVRDVIERRVNGLGVSEPIVQTNKSGDVWRIIVELAGIKDVKQATDAIGETPVLEFKEQSDKPPRALTNEEKEKLKKVNEEQKKRAQKLLGLIQKGEKFENIAKENSEDDQTKGQGGRIGFVKDEGQVKVLVDSIKNLKDGSVAPNLVETNAGYDIVLRHSQKIEDEVGASHILICTDETPGCTKKDADARTLAEELFARAKPVNFATLAKQYSDEPGAKDSAGDLGYFAKGSMVNEFEDAVFAMKNGEISKPLKTKFGYHLIYKRDQKTVIKYDISHILIRKTAEKDILPQADQWASTGLTGSQLKRAALDFDQQTGSAIVSLEFNDEGRDLFAAITKRNINKYVAIFLDGSAISIPVVSTEITDGRAIIQGGNFTVTSAKQLAQRLNAGALPVPITLVSQQTVGASLGEKILDLSVFAGLIGFMVVVLFMILYYRLPGLIASFSLSLYALITLALFKMLPVTLTAASIAGFVLSVGMAIDANVLIFERIKEELQAGRTLHDSIEEGFSRAWFSIRASNVSSLITAFILMNFSTSVVRGFAITLALGIFVSIFTAVTITRYLMRFVILYVPAKSLFFLGARK